MNSQPLGPKSDALPTELSRPVGVNSITGNKSIYWSVDTWCEEQAFSYPKKILNGHPSARPLMFYSQFEVKLQVASEYFNLNLVEIRTYNIHCWYTLVCCAHVTL